MPEPKAKDERVVITIAELRESHGKKGDDLYRKLSTLVWGGPGSGIVTPLAEHERDISLVGIKPEVRTQVEALLASKEG